MSSPDDDGLGLGALMPREPSPEPEPFTYATYTLPEGMSLASGSRDVSIRLVGSHPLWGHHLWNTGRVTTDYILAHPELVRGKRVLELGAGGALPSIASALAGAGCVVATDYADAPLMDNIAHNAAENGVDGVHAVGHTWGREVTGVLAAGVGAEGGDDAGRFDLLILSDLMFNHSEHDALIRTVKATLSLSPPSHGELTPCVLVFLTHHRPWLADADMAFLPALAAHGFAYERVLEEYTGPMFKDDRGDERVRGTVHGFRCWRLPAGTDAGADAKSADA